MEEEHKIVLHATIFIRDNTRIANTIEMESNLTAMKNNTTINIAKRKMYTEHRIEFVIERRINKRFLFIPIEMYSHHTK